MSAPVEAKTRRRLALLFTVPLVFSFVFFIANTRAENTDIEILSTQSMRSALNSLLQFTQDADTSERGYLITGEERYLIPYQQSRLQLKTQIELTRGLFKDRSELRDSVEQLIHRTQYKFDQVDKVLALQRTDGFAAAFQYVKSGTEQDTTDEIRRAIDVLQLELGKELTAAHDHQRALDRGVFLTFLAGTAITVFVLISLYQMLIEYIQGQKAAQNQLALLNADLERRIDRRTEELQRSNEELKQFACVASHDLQEPLRTITSFTQLLAARYKGKLDEDADEFIGYVVTSARRMSELIQGLLALVRLRKDGNSWTVVPLERLVTDAETSLKAAVRDSGARIEVGELPALAVDAVQITQVFQNLMGNAIKYHGQESPLIRVAATRTSLDWVISVADNGLGFEQQYARSIFGMFERIDNNEVQGAGIGLSISQKIVERHGGKIWAESERGAGSTFYFSLPIALEISRVDPHEQMLVNSLAE